MEAFPSKSIVLITLNSPREKFWGSLLSISGAGISVRAIELNSLEDFARQIRAEEPVSPTRSFSLCIGLNEWSLTCATERSLLSRSVLRRNQERVLNYWWSISPSVSKPSHSEPPDSSIDQIGSLSERYCAFRGGYSRSEDF